MDRHTAVAACLTHQASSTPPDSLAQLQARTMRLELLITDLLLENERLRQALAIAGWEDFD